MLAKYSGQCAICSEPIRPGDSITDLSEDSSTWVHTACHPSIEVVTQPSAEAPPAVRRAGQPHKRKPRRIPKAPMIAPAGARSVYTDGACARNPGPGGWAWAIDRDTWASGSEPASTNQRMEIRAALEAVTALDGPLIVVSDSTYVVNCFRDRWWQGWLDRDWINSQNKPVANRDLWEPLVHAVIERGNVAFHWVKGHSGHEMNDFVDHLAVSARISVS
jgi:ribonuclease HI